MERTQLIERARQRAIDEGVKVYEHNGMVLVPSMSTKAGGMWELTIDMDGSVSCDCPGFRFRQSCKHVEAFKLQNAE